jgi:TonB family protein
MINRIRIALSILLAALIGGPAWSQGQSAPPPTALAVQGTSGKETHPPRIGVPGYFEDKNVVYRAPAIYPAFSELKPTGTVVLHAIIAQDGTVKKLDAVSGPETLRQSALDAVKQWKYKPALLNGQPVEVDTTVHVVFSLQPPQPPYVAALATPSAEETQPLRIRVPGDVAKENVIRPVFPTYPVHAAYDLHITGTVLMGVIIAQDGSVQEVGYISGPKELKDAAMDAMREWKYKPMTLNGQPVEVDTTVKMVFAL